MLELARPSDWEEVRRLSVQVHDLHAAWRPDIYYSCEEPYPHGDFLSHINERRVYVAKIGENVAGYLVLSFFSKEGAGIHPCKCARLDSICVDETIRSQGIGKEMIRDAAVLCKAFGCREMLLGVHPENDDAVGFYQKCGFRIRTIQMDMKL